MGWYPSPTDSRNIPLSLSSVPPCTPAKRVVTPPYSFAANTDIPFLILSPPVSGVR